MFAANDIELLATKRSKADGTHPDVARGRGGHMITYADPMFPCYSPDLNWAIEKAWREVQRRVLARATDC